MNDILLHSVLFLKCLILFQTRELWEFLHQNAADYWEFAYVNDFSNIKHQIIYDDRKEWERINTPQNIASNENMPNAMRFVLLF